MKKAEEPAALVEVRMVRSVLDVEDGRVPVEVRAGSVVTVPRAKALRWYGCNWATPTSDASFSDVEVRAAVRAGMDQLEGEARLSGRKLEQHLTVPANARQVERLERMLTALVGGPEEAA